MPVSSTRQRDGLASGLLLPLYQALRVHGLDAEALLQQAQIEPAQLLAGRARISQASSLQFWRLAEQAYAPATDLALATAQQFSLRALGVLGMAWLASTSLREAIRRLVRYYDLVSSVAQLSLEEEGGLLWLQYRAAPAVLPVTHDAWVAVITTLCRNSHPSPQDGLFSPAAVRLAHPRHAGNAALQRFLAAPLQTDAAFTGLGFTAAQLDAPLPAGHPGLALNAEKILAATRANLQSGSTSSQVRAHLLDMLPSGDISRSAVASRMHLTERTLQRRLEAEQFGFAELLQQTRQELAQNLLRDPEHDVQDVAFILGFAEISSFTRAFRRWTGQAPSNWRDAQLSLSS